MVARNRSHLATLAVLLFAATLSTPRPVLAQPRGQITDADIERAVDRSAPAMIRLRHQIHQHPELANREFETSKLVAEQLRSLGLDVRTGIAYTGVVGTLRGGRPGPVVAVRSELDALQVTEDSPYPFKSTVRTILNGLDVGVAHACGHDIHIAGILGVATVLTSMRAQLPGTVIFIFQPAEEAPPPIPPQAPATRNQKTAHCIGQPLAWPRILAPINGQKQIESLVFHW